MKILNALFILYNLEITMEIADAELCVEVNRFNIKYLLNIFYKNLKSKFKS